MDTTELKQKRKEFLDDTVRYYSQDVSRRAIIGTIITKCVYKTTDGKKCAIGRHIPEDRYDSSIEGQSIISVNVTRIIPQEILDLGINFLGKIQTLHDCDDNWNDNGLSEHGESVVVSIECEYCK